jgi:phospholipid transport system substrate-binding protein
MYPPRRLFIRIFFVALACGFAPIAAHAEAGDAAAWVNGLVGQALQTIKSSSLTEPQRVERLNVLLQDNCDIPRITQSVLGRHWTSASPEERKAFTALFARWVVKIYSFGLREIADDTVRTLGTRAENADGVTVSSNVVSRSGTKTPVEWRLHREAGKLRIVDLEISGVSLAQTQREEFASIMQRDGGTVAALNKELDARLRADSIAAAR